MYGGVKGLEMGRGGVERVVVGGGWEGWDEDPLQAAEFVTMLSRDRERQSEREIELRRFSNATRDTSPATETHVRVSKHVKEESIFVLSNLQF